eukprot:s2858_g4.t1
MLLCCPLLSIYASVLVNAVRRDEDIDALNGISVASADASADLTDALETDLARHVTFRNASVGEQFSAEEMQRGLLDFFSTVSKTGGWKKIFPVFKAANQKYRNVLDNAWRSRKKSTSCQRELGGLMKKLTHACESVVKSEKRFSCPQSVEDVFLYGTDVVQASVLGCPEKAPRVTKPLLDAGYFLKEWIIRLATAKKAAILWAGFWTNVSDPEGNKTRTSKERLFDFADLIETQTVHPSTALGRMIEEHANLADCKGPIENELQGNMWSFFSFAFVSGMREKRQDTVVALVHKAMDGERPLSESILFQYEVPAIGIASWGLGLWSPQVVLIDLMGTCKQTSPALRKQLYSGLRRYQSFSATEAETYSKEVQHREDFVLRSRLSWTCLDCPHSHCHLDEPFAKQVKELLQAKRQQDQKGVDLIRAAKAGKVSEVEKLLNDGADVNFQDLPAFAGSYFVFCREIRELIQKLERLEVWQKEEESRQASASSSSGYRQGDPRARASAARDSVTKPFFPGIPALSCRWTLAEEAGLPYSGKPFEGVESDEVDVFALPLESRRGGLLLAIPHDIVSEQIASEGAAPSKAKKATVQAKRVSNASIAEQLSVFSAQLQVLSQRQDRLEQGGSTSAEAVPERFVGPTPKLPAVLVGPPPKTRVQILQEPANDVGPEEPYDPLLPVGEDQQGIAAALAQQRLPEDKGAPSAHVEQAAIDRGDWSLAYMLTLLEEPPVQLFQERALNMVHHSKPFGPWFLLNGLRFA